MNMFSMYTANTIILYVYTHSYVVCVSSVVSGDPPSLPELENDKETEDRPTLPELLRFKIPQQVGTDYNNFGIFLLEDRTGSRVDAIEDECRGKPDRITRKILQEWVGGRGAALT